MITRDLSKLDMMDAWQEDGEASRWKVQFPLLGIPGTGSLGTVYFEIESGQALPSHTDSHDEIVVLLSGTGEGTVGDKTGVLTAGEIVFIPAMVPHGFRNVGSETVRALGIFAGANLVSEFQYDVKPLGFRVFDFEQLQANM